MESVSSGVNEAIGRFILRSNHEHSSLIARIEGSGGAVDIGADIVGLTLEANRELRKLYTTMIGEIDEACADFEEFDTLIDVMVELERIWFLCEIFLLNPVASKTLTIDFAIWIYETERRDVEVLLNFYQTLDAPESFRGGSGGDLRIPDEGYWEAVYQLAVQGSLLEVWQLLCLHSEFPRVDVTESTGSGRRDSQGALELKAIFVSHPYLEYIRGGKNISMIDSAAVVYSGWSRELVLWKERLELVRQSKSSLLGRIPEIVELLNILGGNLDSMRMACRMNWLSFALGKFLYVFPPPLSMSNIAKIVEDSITSCNDLGLEQRSKQQNTIKSIIDGEVGAAIRHMHESKNAMMAAARNAVPFANLAFSLPTGYLCYNLIHGGGFTDLMEPLVPNDLHSSYFEQLLVSVIKDLISHRFPIEIVVRMINICPTLAPSLSTELLPTIIVDSDDLARELSHAIRVQADCLKFDTSGADVASRSRSELISRARSIEVDRGLFWLVKGEASRAIAFFCAAEDYSRCTAVVDSTMLRLVQAVSLSTTTFEGLRGVDLGQAESSVESALSAAKEVLSNISFVSYLSTYVNAIEQFIGAYESRDTNRFAVSASAMAALIDSRKAPRRYLIHFLELIILAYENRIKMAPANKSILTKHLCYRLIEELEAHASSTDFQRTSMGIKTSEMAEIRKKLLSMLSSSCLVENASHKAEMVPSTSNHESEAVDFGPLDLLTGIALYIQ